MNLQTFENPDLLAENLASNIASLLRNAITENGTASMAVSGGSTPRKLFEILSETELDWSSVTVTLVDERWVPEGDDRSNAKLVRANLIKDWARTANFIPLYQDFETPEQGLDAVTESLDVISLPLDVVILGMGTDAHTASFFPGGDNLEQALDPDGKALVCTMQAPGAGEPRITLTLPTIVAARNTFLHIEGPEKKKVLDTALGAKPSNKKPISIVADHCPNLQVFWSQ